MGISVDTVNLRFNVKPNYDQQQLQQLQEDLKNGQKELENTRKAMAKLAKNGLNAMTKEQREEYDRLSSSLSKQAAELHRNEKRMQEYTRSADISKLSIRQLGQRAKDLSAVLNNLSPDTDEFVEYKKELDAVKDRMKQLKSTADETKSSLIGFVEGFNKFAWAAQFAYQGIQKLVSWADQYVQAFAKMDDAMTDVIKYTGQTKAEVEAMNETFAKMTTRTPREELNALAGAAGRLGIQGKEDIEAFVSAADIINVALGDDLGEGAIDQIGKLTMVFGEDKKKGLEGALLATGSAINVLGANSSANTGFITEFTSRMAGMAVNAKISQTDIMGYASALSQAGIEGETASGVFAQMITKMFTDPAKFAKAAKLDVQAFTNLLKTDANAAIMQFLEGLKQNGGFDSLAPALKSLKMQGTQAVPVISSLINKMDELKKAQSDAKQAYDAGTSIIDEFNNANSSAAAKLEMDKKALNDVSVELGQKLMPIVESGLATSKTVLQVLSAIAGFVTRNIATISRLTIVVAGYAAAVQIAVNATKIWTAVTKATPWGLVLSGITAVLVAYDKYKTKLSETKKLQEELNDVESDAINKYSDQAREVKRLDAAMRNERISLEDRKKALDKLKEIIPDYNGMLDKEGQLTRDNKKAIDDYLISLQKQIRLKAYQDKLEELYKRQAEQQDTQREASDKYWNEKQTNTLQGGKNPTLSLMRWLGIGEEASLKRALDTADQALADTNSKIKTLEDRVRDLGGSVVDTLVKPQPGTDPDPDPDEGDGGGNGSTNNNDRDKQRKEAEARLKADFEREKILLKQQYQGKKDLKDEWQLEEIDAERYYLSKLHDIRKQYNTSESDMMEVQNQIMDTWIKEANLREETLKREQAEKLKDIDHQQAAEEVRLSRQLLTGDIKTQDEYNHLKLESEIGYQKKRLEILQKGSEEYNAAQSRLEQLGLEQLRQAQADKTKDQNWENSALQQSFGLMGSFDAMREANQAAYDQELINYQQYQENMTSIAQRESDARQAIQQQAFDAVNGLMSSASGLFSALQQREVSAVDKKYKNQIAAAKKAGRDTTKLEEQMETEKAEIQKKYAQKQFKLQVLQIIAATAQSIANVWREWAWQPGVAAALSALAAAQGAIQLATAKAQADQAAGLYEGGYSEGYTAKGDPHKQAGVIPVHQNEFVANHHAVANPEIRPLLDVIDRHQKIGDIRMLNSTRMLEEAYGGGRARGGYTNSDDPLGDPGIAFRREDDEVMQLLRAIENNTADSLTVRELRKKIKQEERLEQNASR